MVGKVIVGLLAFVAAGILGVGLLALLFVVIAARTASNLQENNPRALEVTSVELTDD